MINIKLRYVVYQNEIKNPEDVSTNTLQIGLMYVSDYGFAASPSAWTTNLESYNSSLINFAQAAYNKDLYPNCRTEMYIELAKAVKNGFWVNDEVKEELLAQSVFINNKGNQQLVPKEEVKKILGHSPDLCDSVALAVYAMNHNQVDVQNKYDDALKRYLHLMGH